MIQYWEALGRLMTHTRFRETVYDTISPTVYCTDPEDDRRLMIPEDDFRVIRGLLKPVMPHQPIGLMVAGELLMCVSFQPFRDRGEQVARAIKATNVPVHGRTPLFYAALGLMLLDDTVRGEFDGGDFDSSNFGSLDDQDQEDLGTLASSADLKNRSNFMCALFWGPECFDKSEFYLTHEHPTANGYPPSAERVKRLCEELPS